MIGDRIGSTFEKAAEILGGLILIGIGVKILLAHTLTH
jgi:putative Mn2+ efflux pump MntP